jgi:hypothetical protein
MGTLLLAGLAGILASLSPCVLPLLPIVLGAATAEHRLAPLALAGGLVIGFAGLGVVLGLLATSIGFDPEVLRIGSAVMLLLAGLALLVAGLATRLTMAGEAIMAPISALAQRMPAQGLGGQLGLGVVLGVAWAPCTGPALGAARGQAAQAGAAAQAGDVDALGGQGHELTHVVRNARSGAAENETRTNNDGKADLLRDLQSLFDRVREATFGHRQADVGHGRFKEFTILGRGDRRRLGAGALCLDIPICARHARRDVADARLAITHRRVLGVAAQVGTERVEKRADVFFLESLRRHLSAMPNAAAR